MLHVEESIRWCRDNPGFSLLRDNGFVPPPESHVCFPEKDGFLLELFEYRDPNSILIELSEE